MEKAACSCKICEIESIQTIFLKNQTCTHPFSKTSAPIGSKGSQRLSRTCGCPVSINYLFKAQSVTAEKKLYDRGAAASALVW